MIRWENQLSFIKDSILNRKTILFVGPGVTYNFDDSEFYTELLKNLSGTDPLVSVDYHTDDELLIVDDRRAKLLNTYKVKSALSRVSSNIVLDTISHIPFHLIFNASADMSLENTFKENNFIFKGDYIGSNRQFELSNDIQNESYIPIIYKLCGSIEDDESLIITHTDVYSHLEMIFSRNSLPNDLKMLVHSSRVNNVLFIGFDFNKWYYQLILHLFDLELNDCINFSIYGNNDRPDVMSLVSKQFSVNFVTDNVAKFMDTLMNEFNDSQIRSVKNKSDKADSSFDWSNIIQYIKVKLSSSEFNQLLLIYFEDVYNNYTVGMSKQDMINMLIEEVKAKQLHKKLLTALSEVNPDLYDKFLN